MSDDNSHANSSNSSDGSVSPDEALSLFLGGLDMADMTPAAWEDVSAGTCDQDGDQDDNHLTISSREESSLPTLPVAHQYAVLLENDEYDKSSTDATHQNADPTLTANAHTWTPDGRCRPPDVVEVVDTGTSAGFVGRATQAVSRGATLWTEQAAAAVVLNAHTGRFCGHCAKSLQPANAALGKQSAAATPALPYADLWPVPPYDDEDSSDDITDENDSSSCQWRRDAHGRVHCLSCRALFCNTACRKAFSLQVGRCCPWQQFCADLRYHRDDEVPSPVWLGARVFVQVLQHYRVTRRVTGTFLDGLCGEADNVGPLELNYNVPSPSNGSSDTDTNQDMVPLLFLLYRRLVHHWSMTQDEQATLHESFWHRCVAVAARNAVGVRLVSPFTSYHAGLVRRTGGFGSDTHAAATRQLAQAIRGGDHGHESATKNDLDTSVKLDRTLDQVLRDRLAPTVAAVFPLTARLNHDCEPSVALHANFVTATIDVVATRNVAAGEELTLSYIYVGPQRNTLPTAAGTARRRRELRAKYLFDCTCRKCTGETN